MSDGDAEEYPDRYDDLVEVATLLQGHVKGLLSDVPHIDRIVARAKDPARFAAKALKATKGEPKYAAPLTQIQDQVGARVVVFYKQDVTAVAEVLERYFRPVEREGASPRLSLGVRLLRTTLDLCIAGRCGATGCRPGSRTAVL